MNRQETLEEALKIVTKDRQNAYGTPEDNFNCIAGLWSSYLGTPITAQQVAVLMILLKVARSKSSPDYADNYVDICGYAACASEVSTETSKVHKIPMAVVSEELWHKIGESTNA